jgi:hypothetical protein
MRSPVASARRLDRSVARLCSIVVILRFVRACVDALNVIGLQAKWLR